MSDSLTKFSHVRFLFFSFGGSHSLEYTPLVPGFDSEAVIVLQSPLQGLLNRVLLISLLSGSCRGAVGSMASFAPKYIHQDRSGGNSGLNLRRSTLPGFMTLVFAFPTGSSGCCAKGELFK